MRYRIKIKGELDDRWSEYFGNIQISSEKDEAGILLTTLEMDAADQSALFGLLNHLQDLNLSLLSVSSFHPKNKVGHTIQRRKDGNPTNRNR